MKKLMSLMAVASLFAATTALADEPVQTSTVFSKYNLTIGGYVKLDYTYNSANGTLGPFSEISPDTGNLGFNHQKDQSELGVNQSRLFFKIDGPSLYGGKTKALIETDFYGLTTANVVQQSPNLRLRQAYGEVDWTNFEVLFGQTWDVFGPFVANTQDFRSGAPYGAPNAPRIPMLKTTTKLNLDNDNQIKIVLAVEDPGQNGDNSVANASGAWGALPNFAGQIAYTSKALGVAPGYAGTLNPFTVNVFGLYGHSHYNFSTAGTPESVGIVDGAPGVIAAVPGVTVPNVGADTYGYGLYTFVPILKSSDGKSRANTASFEGEITYASNMAYNNGTANGFTTSGIGTFAETSTVALSSVTPLKDFGIAGQLEYYPTQSLGVTAGYGSRRAANSASAFAGQQYISQSQEIYFNAAYDLNSAIRLAAEYQNLQATYGNTDSAGNGSSGSYKSIDNIGRLCFYYFF